MELLILFMFDLTNLKKIRKSLNLTQHAFAKKANVSQSLIAKIESNSIDPSYSRVKHIENALDILLSYEESSADKIMTKNVVTADPQESALAVVKKMNEKGISQVPVISGSKIIGLFTETNAVENIEKLQKSKVEEIMREAPPTLAPEAKISAVSSLFKYYPVVLITFKGELKGIITKTDLLKSVVKN